MEVKAFFVIEYVFGTDNNHVYHLKLINQTKLFIKLIFMQ